MFVRSYRSCTLFSTLFDQRPTGWRKHVRPLCLQITCVPKRIWTINTVRIRLRPANKTISPEGRRGHGFPGRKGHGFPGRGIHRRNGETKGRGKIDGFTEGLRRNADDIFTCATTRTRRSRRYLYTFLIKWIYVTVGRSTPYSLLPR